jgi:hypothetical protein
MDAEYQCRSVGDCVGFDHLNVGFQLSGMQDLNLGSNCAGGSPLAGLWQAQAATLQAMHSSKHLEDAMPDTLGSVLLARLAGDVRASEGPCAAPGCSSLVSSAVMM